MIASDAIPPDMRRQIVTAALSDDDATLERLMAENPDLAPQIDHLASDALIAAFMLRNERRGTSHAERTYHD